MKTSSNSNDEYLLYEISKGNRSAFDIIYDRYWKNVFSAAYKRMQNHEEAKDIVQEVFIQLWLRRHPEPIDDLKSYLFIVTRNLVFKNFERKTRLPLTAELPTDFEDDKKTDDKINFDDTIKLIDTLIQALPSQQKRIFSMRYEQEMSSNKIAEELGLSPKTVRNQIGKSISRLKKFFLIILIMLIPALLERRG